MMRLNYWIFLEGVLRIINCIVGSWKVKGISVAERNDFRYFVYTRETRIPYSR